MCGALSATLELCVEYTANRWQFNKPLNGFQAIQQYTAVMAGELVVANAALELATSLVDTTHPDVSTAAAVAKARVGAAAGQIARLAHQVHGAIGFTREYPLHELTRRLWSWRDEYGNERFWCRRLGEKARGGDVWELLTSTP